MRRFLFRLWARIVFLYQTRRDVVEQAISAAGLVVLSHLLYQAQPAYPSDWRPFLLILIFCAALYASALGYFITVALAMWPLWTLSPYLASIFLAIAVLAQSPILRRLSWSLLVGMTPMLAWNLLSGVGPLLAGVTLGPGGGFWVGVLSALWLKVAGGMAGLPTDLLTLHNSEITLVAVRDRFGGANSLQTLQRLVAPFTDGSTRLLLDVLQVLLWGLAGALVGWVRQRLWVERRPWLNLLIALSGGALLILISIFVAPIWVQLRPVASLGSDPVLAAAVLGSALIAGIVYALRHYLNRPIQRASIRILPTNYSTGEPPTPAGTPKPAPAKDKGDDVIMLELD
jgi:hypothetical protein